jgi:hypothetical protein
MIVLLGLHLMSRGRRGLLSRKLRRSQELLGPLDTLPIEWHRSEGPIDVQDDTYHERYSIDYSHWDKLVVEQNGFWAGSVVICVHEVDVLDQEDEQSEEKRDLKAD